MTRGTVILTPFPFTDLQGAKVRPAIVVSRTDRQGDDLILTFISSQRRILFGELGSLSPTLIHEMDQRLKHALALS